MPSRRRIDWSFGPGHGPVSGVLNAAAAALGVTMVADLTAVNPVWPLVGGTVAAAGAALAAVWQRLPERAVCYRAACWFGAGIWSWWTLSGTWWIGSPGTPWSTSSLAALGVASLGAGLVGAGFARAEEREARQREEAARAVADGLRAQMAPTVAPATEHDQVAAEWQRRLRQITRRELTVVGVEFWTPRTGFTLDVDLPEDGTTIDDVKAHEKSLATAANMIDGCNVEVLPSEIGRRAIHIRVATEDALAEDHHLPEDYSAASIENNISLGIQSNRAEATINLRYNCAVLVGQTDSGKSNELNVITTGLVRCTDALVWAIDLSGNGRYPRPWVRAWKEGRAPYPAIDWVAPTVAEAALMVQVAIQIIDGRTAAYEQLMFEQGADKILAAPDLPEIVIVTDEVGKLPPELKDGLTTISDTGRGAAVRTVSCALEAKAGYIPRSMITQSRERIGMRVTDEAELQYLFDSTWSRGRFDPSRTPHKGSGMWATGATAPTPFKGWRMEPARIDRASIAVAELRPDLDDVSVALADTVVVSVRDASGVRVEQEFEAVYTQRWDRTLPVIFPADGARPAPAAATSVTKESDVSNAPDLPTAMADLDAARRRVADAEPMEDPGPADQPLVEQKPDWSVVEGWLEAASPGQEPPRVPPRVRMRQLVQDHRRDGIGPGPVHETLKTEGYPTAYPTVISWMKADAAAGILAQPGGDKTPYFPGPRFTLDAP